MAQFLEDVELQSLKKELPQKAFEFLVFHGPQLKNIGFDLKNPSAIEKLYYKLNNEIFDSCKSF